MADGTYVLTSAVDYGCDGGTSSAPAVKATAQVAGGCLQFVLTGPFGTDAGTVNVTYTASETVAFSGNTVMTTPQCPQVQSAASETYTATATTLTLLSTKGYVQVFTKQ